MADEQIGSPGGTAERPATFFADAAEFRAWLIAHHESAGELWMGLHKRHVTERGLTWVDAVPEALCFGWIDSRVERIDDDTMRQRWTPRRPASVWSTVNVALVEQLTEAGRMYPAGLAAFARRKPERSGVYSHESPPAALPDEYAALLAADPAASAFWAETTPSYRRVATHWVTTAKKPETRDNRMRTLIADSAAGRLIPPQRPGAEPAWLRRAAAAARNA